MSSTLNVTPEQIKAHRSSRKASGLAGCITGRPLPPLDFYGFKDVQSWRPADPMQPHCFCFDCRDLWDNDASIDLQLLKDGNKMAIWAYEDLVPKELVPPKPEPVAVPSLMLPTPSGGIAPPPTSPVLPKRSNGGGIQLLPRNGGADSPSLPARTMTEAWWVNEENAMKEVATTRTLLGLPALNVDTSVPAYATFAETPLTLPAPRHRDIMNEVPKERLKKDLSDLRGQIQSDLVRVMDKRRRGVYLDEPERSEYLHKVDEQENTLWLKLDAVEILLKE
jgi:hypothetical protein